MEKLKAMATRKLRNYIRPLLNRVIQEHRSNMQQCFSLRGTFLWHTSGPTLLTKTDIKKPLVSVMSRQGCYPNDKYSMQRDMLWPVNTEIIKNAETSPYRFVNDEVAFSERLLAK